MQVQVHSDNHIGGHARFVDWVGASVADKLERFDEDLTRVVVHVNDENGSKAGQLDKRCQIEVRPKGQAPLSVTHKADSVDQAVEGALDKMGHALGHLYGKLRAKRPSHAQDYALADVERQDALLEEDFVADLRARSY